jgi:O-antigen/teichoic acid export membrane protein
VRIIKSWQKTDQLPELFKKLMRNWAKIFSGNIASAMLAVVSVSIAGRALGPESVGILFIFSAYIRLVDGAFNFQTHQAIIKFGIDAIFKKDYSGLIGLLIFGYVLDAVTAVCTAVMAAIGLIFFIQLIGVDRQYLDYGLLYCLVICTNVLGVPIAILRIRNRFGFITFRELLTQVVRVVGCLFLWLFGASFPAYILVWLGSEMCGNLFLGVLGTRELFSSGYTRYKPIPLWHVLKRFKGLGTTVVHTNLTSALRLLSDEGDILFVGATMGTAGAALFRVAKQFAGVIMRVGFPLQEAIYPDVARLWAEGKRKELSNFSIGTAVMAGVLGLFLWAGLIVFHGQAIMLTVGVQYKNAGPVMILMGFAYVVALAATPGPPVSLALGRSQDLLMVTVSATLGFWLTLPAVTHFYGLIGVGVAHLVFFSTWLALFFWLDRSALRRDAVVLATGSRQGQLLQKLGD